MIESVHATIEKIAKRLGIPEQVVKQLETSDKDHVFEVRLDNGKAFKAYRVQHSNVRGPYKGGVRYHPNVDLEEIQTLATLMSLKTAAIGIPMGGGKGGIAVNPRELNEAELEELSRKYIRHLHPHIGPDKDIPAPDVNTDSKIIDWMIDEYEQLTGDKSRAALTGKSIAKGGSLGREAATGRGGVIALAEFLRLENHDSQNFTMAIQGFGNVGSYFGSVAKELMPGWKLVAVSDSEAAVYESSGLDADKLQSFKSERGRFKDYDKANVEVISNDEMLGLDVDILVLAGIENSVTANNMKVIRAKYIVEMGNSPITGEASDYLNEQGKIVLPDIIVNSGGVLVSYFEWLQNKQNVRWSKEKVNTQLSQYMKRVVMQMHDTAKELDISLKEAAFVIALKRLTS